MTRRGLFATIAGAIAARFARKPEANAVCWREAGHIFYKLDLKPGDIITFAGVYKVNPSSRFVVTDHATSSGEDQPWPA